MKIKLIYLFLLLLVSFCLLIISSKIIKAQEVTLFISEFLPDPEGSDSGKEWVEIFNNSNQSLTISGWKIKNTSSSGTVRNIVIPNVTINANQYLLIADSSNIILPTANNSIIVYLPLGNVNLFNTNSKIELINDLSITVDSIDYLSSSENISWERTGPYCSILEKSLTANTLGLNNSQTSSQCWSITQVASYPNQNEQIQPVVSEPIVYLPSYPSTPQVITEGFYNTKLQITEIYASPQTGEKEWVEVYNNSNETIELTQFKLSEVNSSDVYEKFMSLNGQINPYQYFAIETSTITLNNTGDQLALFYKQELIDQIDYPSLQKAESYSRIFRNNQYTNDWFVTSKVTKSSLNASNEIEFITLSQITNFQTGIVIKTKGCISFIKSVMPDNYAYFISDTFSLKVKFIDDSDLNIDDCLELTGKLIKTSKDSYFYASGYTFLNQSLNNNYININGETTFVNFEGKYVSLSGVSIKRKYTYSLLLSNDLKMKYPEDFDASDYSSEDSINIEGVIIKLSNSYYIFPFTIDKEQNVLGASILKSESKTFANIGNQNESNILVNDSKINQSSSIKIPIAYFLLLLWILAHIFIFNRNIIALKLKVDKFMKERVKYMNAKTTSYFGKDIFHRNFSKETTKI